MLNFIGVSSLDTFKLIGRSIGSTLLEYFVFLLCV
jgi:hypothetical protein